MLDNKVYLLPRPLSAVSGLALADDCGRRNYFVRTVKFGMLGFY